MSYRALMLLASALTLSAGCLDSFNAAGEDGSVTGGGGDGGVTGAGGDAAVAAPDVIGDFNTKVNPLLDKECGVCHNRAGGIGPGFLEPKPDVLTTLLSYPGLIGTTPETSRLYAKGVHEGPAFLDASRKIVGDWIVEYNTYKPQSSTDGGTSKPSIKPFKPVIGQVNTIDLSGLDMALQGVTITFTPSLVGTSIELSQITVKTPTTAGVHIAHPLFVLWDAQFNATPDPVDSFSNLDETVLSNSSAALGPGTLLLPNYTDQMVNVVFTTIEAKAPTGDGGTTVAGQCKNLAVFTQQVKPLLQANCNTCHVGANPTASLSFDFGRNTDAQVCANALTEVSLANPGSSLLLSKPNPNVNDGHPRKITTDYAGYQTAVTNWINGEK